MNSVYPARKERGHGSKGGARALLLKGCCLKFPGVFVPQVLVEVVYSYAVRVRGTGMGPLLLLVLLRLLAMSLGWGSRIGRSGRALERMQRSKNSAKESCVAASVNVTSLGKSGTVRRKGCLVKAQLKKLRDRELRGIVSGRSNVWGRQRGGVQRQSGAGWSSLCRGILGQAGRMSGDNGTQWCLPAGHGA